MTAAAALWPAAGGALAGAGLALAAAGLRPAPPRIGPALDRLSARPAGSPDDGAGGGPAGRWLAERAGRSGLLVPREDLALLGRTAEALLARQLAAAAAGLLSFSLAGAACLLAGTPLPWAAPAGAALAAGALMWAVPAWDLRAEASRRRRDFRHSWLAYLQLVRLARQAGAGTSEALEYAAGAGDGWAFARLAAAAESSRRAHEPPWAGLAALGRDIGVPEITEFAETAETAGAEGAGIAETLAAQSASLRRRMAADTRAQGNSRTASMIVPLSLLGLGFIVLLAFPPFWTLMTAP